MDKITDPRWCITSVFNFNWERKYKGISEYLREHKKYKITNHQDEGFPKDKYSIIDYIKLL